MQYDKAIKIVRSVFGLSQQQFSERVGIAQSVVSRVESGERQPTENFLEKITQELSVPRELLDFLSDDQSSVHNIDEEDRIRLATSLLGLLVHADGNTK